MIRSYRRRALGWLVLAALSPGQLLPVAHAEPAALAGLRRWGHGVFRRFGFLVYEATLWAGDNPQTPPLALRLDYRRRLRGRAIAEASLNEMRRLGADEAWLARWRDRLLALFPDVDDGDVIIGVYRREGASFTFNDKPLGEIADAEFARRFFGIWLDPATSAPELRAALLQRGDGTTR